MMTIVTTVTLREGAEGEWDQVMRERLHAARHQQGWLQGNLLRPVDARTTRVIVGTWETVADWEAWHSAEAFAETRRRLEGLESRPSEHRWHEELLELHRTAAVS